MTESGYTLGVMVREVKRSSFEESLERIHLMGFECAQMNLSVLGMPTLPASFPPGKAGEIGAAFWAFGLSHAAISGTFNTAHPDAAVRKAGIMGIKTVCESADELGTQIITLSTGTRNPDHLWQYHPDNETPDAWKTMVTTMRSLARVAAANSILLAFEPERTNIVNSVDKAVRLLDEVASDNLKVVLDPINLLFPEDVNRQHEIIGDAFDRLGPHTALVHIKDISGYDEEKGEFVHVPVGKGKLDSTGFFRALKTSKFQGSIITHHLPEEEMPACREFIENALMKA